MASMHCLCMAGPPLLPFFLPFLSSCIRLDTAEPLRTSIRFALAENGTSATMHAPPLAMAADELALVSQWLRSLAHRVRVVA
jgi:hypothetical protein